jgi:hypothetical protein
MKMKAIVLIAAIASPGVASAEQGSARCEVQAKSICTNAGSVSLSAATGVVLLSRGAGFAEASPGSELSAGDRIIVKHGVASVDLGPSCKKQLGANSLVTIVQRDGLLCAASLTSDPSAVAQGRGPDGNPGQGPGPALGQGYGAFYPALAVGGAVSVLAIQSGLGRDNAPRRFGNTVSQPAIAP